MNCVSNSAMKYLRGQKQSKWSVNVLDDSAAGFEDPSFLRPGSVTECYEKTQCLKMQTAVMPCNLIGKGAE